MRSAMLILAALLGGGGAAVLMAWGCALRSVAPSDIQRQDPSSHLASFLPLDWLLPPDHDTNGYEVSSLTLGSWSGFGATVEACSVSGRWRLGDSYACDVAPIGEMRLEQCGWPMHCLECVRADGGMFGKSHLIGGIELLDAPQPTSSTPSLWGPAFRPALPTKPLWAGFGVDLLFYAGVIATLCAGPGAARRFWRMRHHRCPGCGYDRHGLAIDAACPECGSEP